MSWPFKVAIIGLDAAAFPVILPLAQAGYLPNLQRLLDSGAWGVLRSTLHPLSPPAWASFMTGMNPGKHGIFDFIGLDDAGRFRVMNGGDLRAKTLWQRLSEAGRRVAVINVPMTYPPEEVNGVLISGMDAPLWNRATTYPPDLAESLHRRFGGYQVGVPAGKRSLVPGQAVNRYIDRLLAGIRLRGQVAAYLLEQTAPDFFTLVFTATDRVQHALGQHLRGDLAPDDPIAQVYRACDEAIGQVLERMGEDWIVLVMSDHGACAYSRVFEVGTWLVERGWMRVHPADARPWDRLSDLTALGRRLLARALNRPYRSSSRLERFLQRVVWSETRAFALGAFGSIYINAQPRFPQGIVAGGREYERICAQIEEELRAVRDPETDQQIVTAVHRARDIYHGPYLHLAPDLLLETGHDYFVRSNVDHWEGRLVYPAGRYQGRALSHTGRHTRAGILIAAGVPFAGGEKEPASLLDIAPTVLHLSGLPVPASMDGEPLLTWLTPQHRRSHPVAWQDSPSDESRRAPGYEQEEIAEIEARLQGLGYLG